jgi:hypothetical protein
VSCVVLLAEDTQVGRHDRESQAGTAIADDLFRRDDPHNRTRSSTPGTETVTVPMSRSTTSADSSFAVPMNFATYRDAGRS